MAHCGSCASLGESMALFASRPDGCRFHVTGTVCIHDASMMLCTARLQESDSFGEHLLHVAGDAVEGGLILGVAVHCDGAAHMAACR